MSQKPRPASAKTVKKSKSTIILKLFILAVIVIVLALLWSMYGATQDIEAPSRKNLSQPQSQEQRRKSTEPALKDAANELRTTDTNLQKDLDTTELDSEINSIVIE